MNGEWYDRDLDLNLDLDSKKGYSGSSTKIIMGYLLLEEKSNRIETFLGCGFVFFSLSGVYSFFFMIEAQKSYEQK